MHKEATPIGDNGHGDTNDLTDAIIDQYLRLRKLNRRHPSLTYIRDVKSGVGFTFSRSRFNDLVMLVRQPSLEDVGYWHIDRIKAGYLRLLREAADAQSLPLYQRIRQSVAGWWTKEEKKEK